MSHTYNGSKGTRFHYNSDLSGKILIVKKPQGEMLIPIEDLVDFIIVNTPAFLALVNERISRSDRLKTIFDSREESAKPEPEHKRYPGWDSESGK